MFPVLHPAGTVAHTEQDNACTEKQLRRVHCNVSKLHVVCRIGVLKSAMALSIFTAR